MSDKNSKKDFFVSYNKADKQWAKWIAAVLEQDGYTTITQAWDFRPGGNFMREMQNALTNSERTIAVLSKNYLNSKYCQAEWEAALNKDVNSEKRLLIPVRIADVEPEGLLAPIIYIDLFELESDEAAAEKKLIRGVDDKEIPRPRPPFPGVKKDLAPKSLKAKFPGTLPFNNLLFAKNPHFTGRDQVFEKICKGFESGSTVSLTQIITGMGGLGKTQTALEYAYRYADKYECIWWITAENEMDVLSSYKKFAVEMNLLHQDQQDSELIIKVVLNWMSENQNWLFIYDNVESIARDTQWWPKNNLQNILITTREKQFNIGESVDIATFTEEEAISFLESRTGIANRSDQNENATKIANRLGYLPLALEQAAAYIVAGEITYAEYLLLLHEYGLKPLDDAEGVMDYSKTLTETMNISIDKIDLEAAQQLLYLCAYMAPENIYKELFNEGAELLPSPLDEALQNGLENNKIWRQLTKYSLLKKQEDGNGYSMHRLLQEVVRDKIEHDQLWMLCCLSLFYKTYDFEYGDIESHNRFLKQTPHVESCLNTIETKLTDDEYQEKIAYLYNRGGFGFDNLGNYSQSLELYERAIKIREKVLGLDHPSTATSYNNIAGVYTSQGEYGKALELYEKTMKIREKVLGLDHPDTATSYNNIAAVYDSQGEYGKALELYDKALVIREKVLGLDHPDTATSYNNIAFVYARQGEYTKALELYDTALKICEKMLGFDHPDTAFSYNNIAGVYTSQGEYGKALELYDKAMKIYEKVLGLDHPDTATSYNNIAFVYARQGEYTKALE
ncbi:MAG: tetratricopeptide repeat protein, partial [Defluviitaleaceae bacterium]|nr:tetratricopeptide repeat protein [Defluviitaleaceae bacterium]